MDAYFKENEKTVSIHISEWPSIVLNKSEAGKQSSKKEEKSEELELFYTLLTKIRQEKSVAKKSMKAEINLTLDKNQLASLKDMLDDFKAVSSIKEIKPGDFKVEFLN